MAVIQQSQLEQVLSVVGLSSNALTQLADTPVALTHLLEQQARLDRLTQLADQLETALGSRVGWPRLIVERDDQSLAFVTSPSDIEALRAEQHLSPEDALWLKRQLQRQRRTWSTASRTSGLHALRRRERRFAMEQDRAIRRYLRRTGAGIAGILPRLVVLITTLEPGWQADALTAIARQLTAFVHSQ